MYTYTYKQVDGGTALVAYYNETNERLEELSRLVRKQDSVIRKQQVCVCVCVCARMYACT